MDDPFIGQGHDFDFLVGRWRVANRCLRARHAGCNDWERFDAVMEGWTHLDGQVSVDEIAFEGRGRKGMTVRTLDLAARRWSIYWISSTTGHLQAPVHGGWHGDIGEFIGEDDDDGRRIRARYVWERLGPERFRWSQDFALVDPAGGPDGPWERNWVMDGERIR